MIEVKLTMKQMCEHIVKADMLTLTDGSSPTAMQIFNSSPTGELYQVFEWYQVACKLIGEPVNLEDHAVNG